MSEIPDFGPGISLNYTESHVTDHHNWINYDVSYYKDQAALMIKELISRGITIRTAESCTGGGIVNEITNIDGSSGIIDYSIVAYSPEVKQKVLGVHPNLTTDEMIVSMQTSRAMNWGLQKFCKTIGLERKCEVYVSITGWIGSNPVETGYHAIFTLCNHDQTLMSTFNVKVDLGSDKEAKKRCLIKRILLEILDFVEDAKFLPADIVGSPV